MSRRRFYVEDLPLVEKEIILSAETSHHIAGVLRLKAGTQIILFDEKGRECEAKISSIHNKQVSALVSKELPRPLPPPPTFLAQALLKGSKMDLVIRQAVELGITGILPYLALRSITTLRDPEDQTRRARWEKIALEAARLSGHTGRVEIRPETDFSDVLSILQPEDLGVILWEEERLPLKSVLREMHTGQRVILIIGPEGGLTVEEVELARGVGFRVASLGTNILKSETAAIAAIAAVNYERAS